MPSPIPTGWWSSGDSMPEMRGMATDIAAEERRRYSEGLSGLQGAFQQSQGVLSQGIDADLLFSRAADSVGARGIQNVNALRGSLGARGLSPNSGAASSMLSRMMFEQENALTGAKRDIAIENQKQRYTGAAINFNNALNLAEYTNSPVPTIELEAAQNTAELGLAHQGLRAQADAQRRANRTNILSAILGGGLGILGKLVG